MNRENPVALVTPMVTLLLFAMFGSLPIFRGVKGVLGHVEHLACTLVAFIVLVKIWHRIMVRGARNGATVSFGRYVGSVLIPSFVWVLLGHFIAHIILGR